MNGRGIGIIVLAVVVFWVFAGTVQYFIYDDWRCYVTHCKLVKIQGE